MTDKEFNMQKKRVQKYIDRWFKTLGLGWFKVDMNWSRERDEREPKTAGYVNTLWQYRSASITWFLPAVADCDDDSLEGVVVHEFTHILVAPLMAVSKEEDLSLQHEYATESLARAFIWAREAGRSDK